MRLMKEFKPDIVIHAAALKHVPNLERGWSEAIKTNMFGLDQRRRRGGGSGRRPRW